MIEGKEGTLSEETMNLLPPEEMPVEETKEEEDSISFLKEPIVEVIAFSGSDEEIAAAAWTSSTIDITDERRERIPTMLDDLWRMGHTSPFEHSSLRFRIVVDSATHIQLLRHRVGVSFNVESGRYRQYRNYRCWLPPDWPDDIAELLVVHARHSFAIYESTLKELEKRGIPRKRAKESARYALPMSLMVEMVVSFNLRSFFHFLRLRDASDAQAEIHTIAAKMRELVEEDGRFKYALMAFKDNL